MALTRERGGGGGKEQIDDAARVRVIVDRPQWAHWPNETNSDLESVCACPPHTYTQILMQLDF